MRRFPGQEHGHFLRGWTWKCKTNREEQQASVFCLHILTKISFANFSLSHIGRRNVSNRFLHGWPEIDGGGGGGMPTAFLSTSVPPSVPPSVLGLRPSILGCPDLVRVRRRRRRLWPTLGDEGEGDCSPREGKRGATGVRKPPKKSADVKFALGCHLNGFLGLSFNDRTILQGVPQSVCFSTPHLSLAWVDRSGSYFRA